MDLNILRLTYFLILKRRALALFTLMERSLTNGILPTKVCINFYTYVFNTFSTV